MAVFAFASIRLNTYCIYYAYAALPYSLGVYQNNLEIFIAHVMYVIL